MLLIQSLKLPVSHTEEELEQKIRKTLRCRKEEICSWTIKKRSVDARRKPELFFVYTIAVKTKNDSGMLHKCRNRNVILFNKKDYSLPEPGKEVLTSRPVVVGFGPAGLFCAYHLAEAGYRPIVLERGSSMEKRILDVDKFWNGEMLSERSNVQFGEGGAGTFSDGKLNTMVKDEKGRGKRILELFSMAGADKAICYENKPHIGTDCLQNVIVALRENIISMGGEVRFESQVTDLLFETDKEGRKLRGLVINGKETLFCSVAVFCIGHSARDTFSMLYEKGVAMEPKSFAVGLRIEHPQKQINMEQYGTENPSPLKAADYKLTYQDPSGRAVFTFCMCPGGHVVNASSEPGRLAVNGMSLHARDGRNANSAVIVSVTPDDFSSDTPLAGIEFQRMLEERAFQAADGRVPVQLLGDFEKNITSESLGGVLPDIKGKWGFGNLRQVLPEFLSLPFLEGIHSFEGKLPGFSRPDAVLSGVESRTSSPVRICRKENMESGIQGLYPCGEGAGYAGGIMSAAMDGMKAAEKIISRFSRPETEGSSNGT